MGKNLPAEIKNIIQRLDVDDLITLNRIVVERIKHLTKVTRINQMSKFTTGDRVSFDVDGRIITGTIIRLNQKTVSVDTDDGGRWKVAPHFIVKLIE